MRLEVTACVQAGGDQRATESWRESVAPDEENEPRDRDYRVDALPRPRTHPADAPRHATVREDAHGVHGEEDDESGDEEGHDG